VSAAKHFAVDGTWLADDSYGYEQVPACGNDFHGRKNLTDDPEEVSCKTCRELLGLDVQMTEVHSDPFAGKLAA
jgi:hypothetical protein